MSTISEIDIRDWDKIDIPKTEKALMKFDWNELASFIKQVEQLRDKQIKEATKNVAALFKPKE